ncbi:MAG: SRPBCC family protein [Saprospiraceae bacterium]|nr:SRPBCC family protein [Saprospiraceae bacterium]
MQLSTSIDIHAPVEAVWNVVTNIEDAPNRIEAIESVEILERPEHGLVGLKWKEVRTLFGKQASEVMWVTDAEENRFYKTRAESHGAIYISTISVDEKNGVTTLTMSFDGTPVTFGAKVMSALMGWMMKGATQKALAKDLEDIKEVVESAQSA